MTKLIVTPIDMSAPGSFRERQRLLRAVAAVQEAQKGQDVIALTGAFDVFEALVSAHAETDDSTTVSEALEMASADEFDALLVALGAARETVPNRSSAS